MKKLIAILCAVAVLATSLFGALVFTAAAEETVAPVAETGDDVKLAYWEDEFGNEIQLWPGSLIGVPSNITSDNFSLVKNTTKLPLTSLFSYSIPEGKTSAGPSLKMSETIDPSAVKGAIFYVEIPDFGTVSHTYDMGTPDDTSDDQTRSSNLFRLALSFTGYDYQRDSATGAYLYNADGSIKTSSKTYLTYGSPDWYICEVGTDKWKTSGTKTYYGVGLPSGWKGYVCIPFASLNQENYNITADSRITGVNIRQLRSTTDVFRAEHNTNNPEYGYLPEDKAFVISEPLWMLGNYTEGANEFYQKDSFCIDGVSYNLITGKAVDFSNNFTKFNIAKAFKTYESTTEAIEGGTYGYRNIVPSTSILTSNKGLWTTAVRTYNDSDPGANAPGRGSFPAGTLFSELTSSTKSGFIFHVSVPAQDEGIVNRVTINIYGTKSDGTGPNTRSLDTNVGGTQTVYLLKDGATAWETRTEGVEGDWYNNYYPILNDGSEPWSGYIFIPKECMNNWGTGVYNLQEVRVITMNGRYTNKSPNTQDKTLGASAVSMVNGFDPASTIMYGDDNRIVDLAKGEILDLDYFSAKEFVGKEGLLPEIPTNVIRADVMPLREFALAGNAVGSNVFTGGTIATGATYVPSASPINKMPLFSVSGTVANSATSQGVQFDVSNNKVSEATIIRCDDVDGFMFYVKNTDTAVPIRFGAAIMTSSDGVTYTTKYSIYNDNPTYLLAKDSDKWTTAGNEGLGGMKIIPANFEGWVYIPKFDTLKKQYTLCWRFNIYMGTTSEANVLDFDFGSFMTVRAGTFTTENAGYALVNDAVAVQDMWSGDFAVINDYNKDMRVDLLDLARSDIDADEDTKKAFKDSYLANYLANVDLKKSVDKTFTLNSFTGEDSELYNNPERGYRTELPVYIKNGTPDPLYYYPTYPSYEPDSDWVNGVYFETEAEAKAWINAEVAKQSTVNLIYYQSTKTLVDTATMNAADTFVIDAKTYTKGPNAGKTLYYVYRAFEKYEDAEAFCYGEFNLKGDNAHISRAVDVGGKTYYTVRYDDRTVFTGMTEAEQKKRFEYVYRIYFNRAGIDDAPYTTLAYIYLSDWNGATAANPNGVAEVLPDDALQTVSYFFEVLRGHDVKAEARFCYNGHVSRDWKFADVAGGNSTQIYNDDWLAENCANEATILKHIDQLAPIVAEYKDAIFNLSCGFIGYVGEMANGYQYPHVDYAKVQKAIVEKLCVPNNLYFSTRDPSYKEKIRESYPNWEYFDSVATNCDSFWGEQTNAGWNSGGFQKGNPSGTAVDWWEYVTANAAYTPQGGEMFCQTAMIPNKVPTGLQAILQLAHHRYTTFSFWHGYLEGMNTEGNIMKGWMEQEITPEILDANGIAYDPAWFKDGVKRNCYEFIRDHLGYRLVADTASVNWGGKENDTINVSIDLKNYGFAAAFNLESGIVILDENGNVIEELKVGNPKTWYNLVPDYYTVNRNSSALGDILTHTISAEFAPISEHGKYRVGFYLKNNAGKYVHLANDLEFVDGYNIVGDFVVINKSHNHYFAPANCGAPQTCSCGETRGVPTGKHTYYGGKCTVCETPIDVTGTLGNVMIMGDSISTYNGYTYGQYGVLGQAWYGKEQDNTDLTGVHQTWWNILISNMDATLAYNRSCSGSTIAEARWSDGVATKAYNSFNARLDEVLSHNELQMFGYTPEDIDTFIFFGGTNDNNVANIGEPKYSDWTAEDLKYFAPAYCRYIATIKANFPNAKIVSLVDTTLKQVADTQIAINEYYGITTVTINGFDEVAPHPTVKGMRQIEETLRIALSK